MSYIKVTRSRDKKIILIPLSSVIEIQDNLIIQNVAMQVGRMDIDETAQDIEMQIMKRELSLCATTGLLANSGGPIQTSVRFGFGPVNCGFDDIYGFAAAIAEGGVEEHFNGKKEEEGDKYE